MYEPMDNLPMFDWSGRRRGSRLREALRSAEFRRRLADFAKFVTACVLNETMTPEEMVEAWLAQTFEKPERTN